MDNLKDILTAINGQPPTDREITEISRILTIIGAKDYNIFARLLAVFFYQNLLLSRTPDKITSTWNKVTEETKKANSEFLKLEVEKCVAQAKSDLALGVKQATQSSLKAAGLLNIWKTIAISVVITLIISTLLSVFVFKFGKEQGFEEGKLFITSEAYNKGKELGYEKGLVEGKEIEQKESEILKKYVDITKSKNYKTIVELEDKGELSTIIELKRKGYLLDIIKMYTHSSFSKDTFIDVLNCSGTGWKKGYSKSGKLLMCFPHAQDGYVYGWVLPQEDLMIYRLKENK